MAKLTLTYIDNLAIQTSAQAALNGNFSKIATALENTLSRDGTSPNFMLKPLDMNGNYIFNLPAPVSSDHPVRLQDLQAATGALTTVNVAAILAAPGYASAAALSAQQAASYVGAATQAPKWTTPRNFYITGDVQGSRGGVDGTADVYIPVSLTTGAVVNSLGYTPANRGGDYFTGLIYVGGQPVTRVAVQSATGNNSGRITYGTSAPTGTPDEGELYIQYIP